jgi:hypothetical protein
MGHTALVGCRDPPSPPHACRQNNVSAAALTRTWRGFPCFWIKAAHICTPWRSLGSAHALQYPPHRPRPPRPARPRRQLLGVQLCRDRAIALSRAHAWLPCSCRMRVSTAAPRWLGSADRTVTNLEPVGAQSATRSGLGGRVRSFPGPLRYLTSRPYLPCPA